MMIIIIIIVIIILVLSPKSSVISQGMELLSFLRVQDADLIALSLWLKSYVKMLAPNLQVKLCSLMSLKLNLWCTAFHAKGSANRDLHIGILSRLARVLSSHLQGLSPACILHESMFKCAYMHVRCSWSVMCDISLEFIFKLSVNAAFFKTCQDASAS